MSQHTGHLSSPSAAAVLLLVMQVCQVYDSAECVRNIHPDPSWRQAASAACQVGCINCNRLLLDAVQTWPPA